MGYGLEDRLRGIYYMELLYWDIIPGDIFLAVMPRNILSRGYYLGYFVQEIIWVIAYNMIPLIPPPRKICLCNACIYCLGDIVHKEFVLGK